MGAPSQACNIKSYCFGQAPAAQAGWLQRLAARIISQRETGLAERDAQLPSLVCPPVRLFARSAGQPLKLCAKIAANTA